MSKEYFVLRNKETKEYLGNNITNGRSGTPHLYIKQAAKSMITRMKKLKKEYEAMPVIIIDKPKNFDET